MSLRAIFIRSLLVLGVLSPTLLSAERIYILFDPACMDRVEYDFTRPEGRSVHLAYHVNVRPGEKLILEIGDEGANQQNYVPTPYVTCANNLDAALVRRINSNVDEVYVVYPRSDRRFNVSLVRLAATYQKTGSVITYESPKYRFRFDINNGAIGENIALNNPGVKVYFEGRMENDCNGNYLFRQLSPQSAYPLIDLVLTPEFGIIEERSGANANAAQNNSMVARDINGKRPDRYLLEICDQEPGTRPAASTTTPMSTNYPPPAAYTPATGSVVPAATATPTAATPVASSGVFVPVGVPTATAQPVAPAATAPSPTTHTVQRGETLYGIAGKYGISVAQVKSWNNLTDNTIRSGQQLMVTPPIATLTARSPEAAYPPQPAPGYNAPQANLAWNQPAAATNDATPQPAWVTTSGVHTVQPGETVASIAMMYGYTEARFRYMNDLGPNDFIKVGQRMRTIHTPAASSAGTPAAAPANNPALGSSYVVPNEYSSRGAAAPATTQPAAIVPSGSPVTGYAPAAPGSAYPANAAAANPSYSSVIPQAYDASAGSSTISSRSLNDFEGGQGRAIMPQSSGNYGASVPTGGAYTPAPNNPYNPYQAAANQPATSYDAGAYQPAAPTGNRRVHIVQEGESMFGIAQRYNTTPDRLRQLNNLSPAEVIMPFQRLFID